MASKPKSIPGAQQRKGFGKPNLAQTAPISQLRRADALMQQQKWLAAKTLLQSLHQAHPQDREVLVMWVNTCLEMGEMVEYGKVCSLLVQIEPKNADATYALAGAYMANGHPLLALQTLRTAIEKFPDHEKSFSAPETIANLTIGVDEMLDEMGLVGEVGLKVAILHEQGQAYLAQGDLDLAQQAEEEALRLRPDTVSVRNNLSLIHWQRGDLDHAIAIAGQVLEQEPDNIHALSNLIHFYYLIGDFDRATPLGDRLKASPSKAWDRWTKKAEGLSYLRDDAGVLDIWAQAQAVDEADSISASPTFLHLVGVALARLGRIPEARQIWQKLLKRSPNYDPARENLRDINQPLDQRQGAWPFPLACWLNSQIVSDLQHLFQSLADPQDPAEIAKATERYLAERPAILKLLPILLERGDPTTRELMIHLITLVKTPEMLAALKVFALGQWGSDAMRYQAASKVVEAGLLPREKVRLWIKGEWQEIMILAYEFHNEPSVVHTHPVENLMRQAIALLKSDGEAAIQQAEDFLQQALQAEPNAPDVLNNLAIVYMRQGREAEAKALLHQITVQHPDYVLAQISLARLHLAQNEIDAAETLLKPILLRQRFSFTEFGEFSDGYLFLLMAQKNMDGALGWLKMWEGIDPEHPKLSLWKTRLGGANPRQGLARLASQFKPRQ